MKNKFFIFVSILLITIVSANAEIVIHVFTNNIMGRLIYSSLSNNINPVEKVKQLVISNGVDSVLFKWTNDINFTTSRTAKYIAFYDQRATYESHSNVLYIKDIQSDLKTEYQFNGSLKHVVVAGSNIYISYFNYDKNVECLEEITINKSNNLSVMLSAKPHIICKTIENDIEIFANTNRINGKVTLYNPLNKTFKEFFLKDIFYKYYVDYENELYLEIKRGVIGYKIIQKNNNGMYQVIKKKSRFPTRVNIDDISPDKNYIIYHEMYDKTSRRDVIQYKRYYIMNLKSGDEYNILTDSGDGSEILSGEIIWVE